MAHIKGKHFAARLFFQAKDQVMTWSFALVWRTAE